MTSWNEIRRDAFDPAFNAAMRTALLDCANALTMDWGMLLENGEGNGRVEGESWRTGEGDGRVEHKEHKECFDYVFGNPPFLGAMLLLPEQKEGLKGVFEPKQKLLGELDFVTAWFKKASDLIQGTSTRCAFVSTNSITQGEQVAPLWKNLNAEIDFAYRTFKWHNEAKHNAAVHCVIIGFHACGGDFSNAEKAEFGRRGEEETTSASSVSSSASPRLSNLRVKESRDEIAAAAHARIDALVDKAYGRSFSSDSDRVAHLFRLYADKVEKWEGGKVGKCSI